MNFASNNPKLRRIMDKMPNASEAELKAEYIKNGGLLNEAFDGAVEEIVHSIQPEVMADEQKETIVLNVKKAARKVVKKTK